MKELLHFGNTHKIVRNLRDKTRNMNPGIQRRLELLEDSLPEDFSLEDIEENESDMMNAQMSYVEHRREMAKRKHTVRVKILEKKYFKPDREPALLTWEEREQICQLHNLDPKRWNEHTLSLGFPATPSVIKKILQSSWKISTPERINLYNETVLQNWKMLHAGKLKISDELESHLKKFTTRKNIILPPLESRMVPVENLEEPVSKEFSSLLSNPRQSESVKQLPKAPEDETYVIDQAHTKSNTLSTLDEYRKKILSSDKVLDVVDKVMVNQSLNRVTQDKDSIQIVSPSDFGVEKYEQEYHSEIKSCVIPEKIKIPCHLKGKGRLYKLDDCYYDVDGEFLYRVPGMIGTP